MEKIVTTWGEVFTGFLTGTYISLCLLLDDVYKQIFNYDVKPIGHWTHEDYAFWFKLGTSAILFCYSIFFYHKKIKMLNKSHKHKIETQSVFDAKILAGNDLKDLKLYDKAIGHYQKALDLNFDNDTAQHKINEVKHLIDMSK